MRQLEIERADLPRLLNPARGLRGIELGVASGDFSARLWQSGAFEELWGVDAYGDHHDTSEYIAALKLVGLDANYRLLRMRFDEALRLFPDGYFDFIYIDGYAHTGEDAGKTLYDWHAKLKVGGLIAGHDYHADWPLVVKSVDQFAADAGMDLMLTQLTSDPGPQDKYPSWAGIRTAAQNPPYPDLLRNLAPPPKRKRKKRRDKGPVSVDAGIVASRSPKKLFRRLNAKVKTKLPEAQKKRLAALQNTKTGGRCLIVGSAPSVKSIDLSRVNGCDVFAMNRAGDLCSDIDAGETMLVISDPLAFEDLHAGLAFDRYDRIFLSGDIEIHDRENVYYFDYYRKPRIYEGFAQSDLSRPLYHCHTVAGFAIQIAVAMGYREIYLVGVDLSFDSPQVHFYESNRREQDWARKVSIPKTPRMQAGLAYLAHWAEKRGVKILNLSPQAGLQRVERARFEDVFAREAGKGGPA
ncbi:MAG: class I SAM-dependent methyltransferase [Rhodovulum sp.]